MREVDLGMRDHLLYELARDLSSSLELDVVLRKVMDRVITLMKAARGFIVLVDPVTNTMSVQMSSGEADEEKARQFLGSKTVIEHVVRTGQAVVSTDASIDDRFKGQQSVIMQNLRSIIAVLSSKRRTKSSSRRSLTSRQSRSTTPVSTSSRNSCARCSRPTSTSRSPTMC